MNRDAHHPTSQVSSTRVEFLQYAHQDLQAMIRLLDAKAGVFVTLLVFLIAGVLPLVKDVSARLVWTGPTKFISWAYAISFLTMILVFVATVIAVHYVIRPRSSDRPGIMRGVMFYADVLGHSGPEHYDHIAKEVSDEALLKDLTTGIFNLSRIVERKTRALHIAKWPTLATFVVWAVNTSIAVTVLTKNPGK